MQDSGNKRIRKFIAQIEKKPHEGTQKFYNNYGRSIYFTAFNICRSKQMTEEVVNDVLVIIWKNASSLKRMENPIGWICTVTANKTKDKLRQEKMTFSLAYDMPDRTDHIQELIDEQFFFKMIENLNDREREIIIGKIAWGESFVEIAQRFSMPLSSVSSTYYRALKKLQKDFKIFKEDE